MTWWAWLLIGWAGTICLVGLFVGRALRRIDEIEWTVPAQEPPAPAPAPALTPALTPAPTAAPAPAPAPAAGDLVA